MSDVSIQHVDLWKVVTQSLNRFVEQLRVKLEELSGKKILLKAKV